MEKRRRAGGEGGNRGMEENTMAILDTSGFNNSKIYDHLNDDRLAFLEAVRTASLLPDNGSAPTRKMFETIFHILKDADSVDLIIESYQLLIELDKRFPRVYLSKGEQSDSTSHAKAVSQIVMVEEAWLPFNFGLDSNNEKGEARNPSRSSVDSSGFHALIQEVAKVATEMKSEAVGTQKYELDHLEGVTTKHASGFVCLDFSLGFFLQGSRKIVYKGLVKDCLSLMCDLSQLTVFSEETSYHKNSSGEQHHEIDYAMALALPEIMELDSSRRIADHQGLTTRADSDPVVDIILDELIYDDDILCSFLQVFDPKWKLEIVVQYFLKYITKYSVQTRRSSGKVNIENLNGVLKCLSNRTSTRSIIKKISTELIQLLLAYAFQAYVLLSYQHVSKGLSDKMEDDKSNSIVEVCKNMISAFACLRQENPDTEILCIGKEALFTAATMLSKRS
ncbi:UNVERIFIED_CONTAM: Negative regulator of systemic acquired resistance SNI1 [Sesamum calycinum]|uniref:Negative regulator of systemic acquired resistance SNI1 n=1 Tax=Sesamum calycinum TaxID=2727403 RepID=A0AAW2Q6N4_9LAMI